VDHRKAHELIVFVGEAQHLDEDFEFVVDRFVRRAFALAFGGIGGNLLRDTGKSYSLKNLSRFLNRNAASSTCSIAQTMREFNRSRHRSCASETFWKLWEFFKEALIENPFERQS
jgi:hypothetical protein